MTPKEEAVVKEAYLELLAATQQMLPTDDHIICDRVRRAEGMLRALVGLQGDQDE